MGLTRVWAAYAGRSSDYLRTSHPNANDSVKAERARPKNCCAILAARRKSERSDRLERLARERRLQPRAVEACGTAAQPGRAVERCHLRRGRRKWDTV